MVRNPPFQIVFKMEIGTNHLIELNHVLVTFAVFMIALCICLYFILRDICDFSVLTENG